jgi:hypothetical protein
MRSKRATRRARSVDHQITDVHYGNPGASGGGGGKTTPPTSQFYVAENGTTFYVAENGTDNYITENSV